MRQNLQRWQDHTGVGTALSLVRSNCIVHGGWQIGAGEYAANGVTTQEAAEPPTGTLRLYSTSVGVFAMTSSAGTMKVYLSPDGIDPYVEKLSTAAGRMHAALPLLVEAGAGNIFIFEYCTDQDPITNNTNRIWYSSDGGDNWGDNAPAYDDGDPLMTTAADSIRHFHGGYYDSVNSRLYVFTGDSNLKSSILHCGDVADLVANPSTWRGRWGLDNATRSNLNASYYVGYNSQWFRTVGMIAHGDYLYYGADTYGISTGVQVSRVHRTTLRASQVHVEKHSHRASAGNAVGEVWSWGTTANGLVLMGTQARPDDETYYGDGWMHVYLLQPDGRTMREIYRIPKGSEADVLAYDIHAVGDYTVINPYNSHFSARVGKVVQGGVMQHDPVLMKARLMPQTGIKTCANLLLESGDALLLESGDYLLGES